MPIESKENFQIILSYNEYKELQRKILSLETTIEDFQKAKENGYVAVVKTKNIFFKYWQFISNGGVQDIYFVKEPEIFEELVQELNDTREKLLQSESELNYYKQNKLIQFIKKYF